MQSISVLILLLIVVFDIKLFLNTFSLTNHEISNGIHIKYCPASRLSLNKSWLSSGRHEFRPYLIKIFCGYICLLRLSRKDCQAFLRFGNQNVFRIEKKNGIEVSNIFYSDRR